MLYSISLVYFLCRILYRRQDLIFIQFLSYVVQYKFPDKELTCTEEHKVCKRMLRPTHMKQIQVIKKIYTNCQMKLKASNHSDLTRCYGFSKHFHGLSLFVIMCHNISRGIMFLANFCMTMCEILYNPKILRNFSVKIQLTCFSIYCSCLRGLCP